MGKRLATLTGFVLVFLLAAASVASAEPVVTAFKFDMMPSVTSYGGSSHIAAALLASGTPLPNRRIVLQRSFNGADWTTVTTMFSTTGAYATDVGVVERMQYRLLFRGDGASLAATSPIRTVTSRAYLTAPGAAGRVYKGTPLDITGYLKPRHAAGKGPVSVETQQLVSGVWKPIKTYATQTSNHYSYSKYTQAVTLPYTGSWRMRAVHADGNHAKTVTGWTYTTVVPDPTIRLSGTGPLSAQYKLKKGNHKVSFTCVPDDPIGFSYFWVDRFWAGTLNGRPIREQAKVISSKSQASSGSTSFYLTADTLTTLSVQSGRMSWTLTITND